MGWSFYHLIGWGCDHKQIFLKNNRKKISLSLCKNTEMLSPEKQEVKSLFVDVEVQRRGKFFVEPVKEGE